MSVLSFCFCKDYLGNFGLVRSYSKGLLAIQFDGGVRHLAPKDVTFI